MKFEVSQYSLDVILDNGITLNYSPGMFTKEIYLEQCTRLSTSTKFDDFVDKFIKMSIDELKVCRLTYNWHNSNGESEFHVEQGKFSYSGGETESGEFTFSIEINDDNREQLNKLLLDVSKTWGGHFNHEECCENEK